jgi:hypothetical protein
MAFLNLFQAFFGRFSPDYVKLIGDNAGQLPVSLINSQESGSYTPDMPCIARIVVPGLPHHITQRGNHRQDVFLRGRYCWTVTGVPIYLIN